MGRPAYNISGNRYGELLVIQRTGNDKHGQALWLCRCDCGNEKVFPSYSLRNQKAHNCGEHNRIFAHQRFGRLIALEVVGSHASNGGALWRCACDCGSEVVVIAAHLRNGNTSSCGCLKRERTIEIRTIHGYAKSKNTIKRKTYRAWAEAIKRCTKTSCQRFKNYGGRGISICDRWRNSFESFLSDMGDCPHGFSLERIDVNGNYEPSNCTWIPLKDQQKNTTRTRRA